MLSSIYVSRLYQVHFIRKDRLLPNAFVKKLKGLANLSPVEVDLLQQATANGRSYPPRHDLIREGDKPGPVFVVLEGWACRYKLLPEGGRQVMAFLMPGDFCDIHISILQEMDHNLATITHARVATIPGGEMETLVESSPNLARALWKAQLIDEATLRAWIVSMGRRGSLERVAHLMCELYLRGRNIGIATHDSMSLPLTQVILADSLGMTPVHINRILRDLRLEGAMELGRGMLSITDPPKLARIAGFDENYLHRRLQGSD